MTTVTNQYREVIQRWFDAMNSNDIEKMKAAFKEYYAPNYRLHDPTWKKPEMNFEDHFEVIEHDFGNMLNMKAELQDFLQDGDKTATRATIEWTDRETKESHKLAVIFISRFEENKIAEEWQLTAPI